MKLSSRLTTVTAGLALAATGLGLGTAFADPAGSPTYRTLAGVGSDTTEEVVQGLSEVVAVNGVKQIASYNAQGTAQITTKDPATSPSCTINRPNGSGAGRDALQLALTNNTGCLDFARSSSSKGSFVSPAGAPKLSYVPYAKDAVAFAVTSTSALPRKLTFAQLQDIYKCVTTGGGTYKPLLPQNGSGTRSFWLTKMYGSSTVNLADFPCVKDNAGQEHDGRILDDNSIVPFSIAQYIAMAGGTVQDKRGRAVLGQVDGTQPLNLNTGYANLTRNVYNIIPQTKTDGANTITDPTYTAVFGPTGQVCTGAGAATIQQYGFGLLPAECGKVENSS